MVSVMVNGEHGGITLITVVTAGLDGDRDNPSSVRKGWPRADTRPSCFRNVGWSTPEAEILKRIIK